MTNCPRVGVVKVKWPISTFRVPGHIFGADEARDFKFEKQVDRNEACVNFGHVLTTTPHRQPNSAVCVCVNVRSLRSVTSLGVRVILAAPRCTRIRLFE